MQRLIPILAWMVGLPSVPATNETALTTLAAVHALTNQQADRRLPASFEATVTYFRDYEKTLFVQDGDAAIYVNATTDLPLIREIASWFAA